MVKLYTIGYGGRAPQELLERLQANGIATVADVRLRPDKAAMGAYARAKTPDKGIERLLAEAGITYVSLVELGNPFMELDDWPDRYRQLLDRAGDLLTERLVSLSGAVCVLCAEKRPEQCHRALIAAWLQEQGWEVEHLAPS